MIEFFLTKPLPLAFAGAHCLWYALLGWGVIAVRLTCGRTSSAERKLMLIVAISFAMEFVQVVASGVPLSGSLTNSNLGITRYFGVMAPLLWIWTAKAISDLWFVVSSFWRWPLRVCVVLACVWFFLTEMVGTLSECMFRSAGYDVAVAARRIARVIRRDYAGPARQAKPVRTMQEYFTGNRPVVFSNFGVAAWMVRGDSGGATQMCCPYQDDYLFIRVGSGYRDIETVDSKVYEYVTSVRGGFGSEWRLFRRRSTPHNPVSPLTK